MSEMNFLHIMSISSSADPPIPIPISISMYFLPSFLPSSSSLPSATNPLQRICVKKTLSFAHDAMKQTNNIDTIIIISYNLGRVLLQVRNLN